MLASSRRRLEFELDGEPTTITFYLGELKPLREIRVYTFNGDRLIDKFNFVWFATWFPLGIALSLRHAALVLKYSLLRKWSVLLLMDLPKLSG